VPVGTGVVVWINLRKVYWIYVLKVYELEPKEKIKIWPFSKIRERLFLYQKSKEPCLVSGVN